MWSSPACERNARLRKSTVMTNPFVILVGIAIAGALQPAGRADCRGNCDAARSPGEAADTVSLMRPAPDGVVGQLPRQRQGTGAAKSTRTVQRQISQGGTANPADKVDATTKALGDCLFAEAERGSYKSSDTEAPGRLLRACEAQWKADRAPCIARLGDEAQCTAFYAYYAYSVIMGAELLGGILPSDRSGQKK